MKKIISLITFFSITLILLMGFVSISSKKAEAQNIGSLQSIITPGFSFKKDLMLGDTDPDVKELQRVLNADIDTMVTTEGDGSRGKETTYFGALTKTAVIKFQNKYKDAVLTLNGLTVGNGMVDKLTRTKLNLLIGVMNTYDSVGLPQSRASSPAVYVSPAPAVTSTPTQSSLSVCSFVELLINIGAVTSDRANSARSVMGCPVGTFVDLKVNGQNGSIIVSKNSAITLSWTTGGVLSCTTGGNSAKPLVGSEGYTMGTASQTFTFTCRTANGTNISDSVSVNISGATPVATSTSPTLLNTSQMLFAYTLALFKIDTDVPTKAYITYRTNSSDAQTVSFTTLKSTRTEIVTGLTPGTTYFVKIRIVNASGGDYTSPEYTVKTTNNPTDNGTATATTTSGLVQRVLSSGGGAGMVSIASSASLNLTDKITLEAWVKPTKWSTTNGISGTKDQVIISRGNIGENMDYALTLDNGKLVYSNNDVSMWTCSSSAIPLNQWTHVAVAIDESTSTINFYINGVKISSATTTATTTSAICEGPRGVFNKTSVINKSNAITNLVVTDPTSNVHLGNFYSKACDTSTTKSNGFIGFLDDVRIWGATRTEAQIKDNMRKSVKGELNLVGYYSFDDGTASDISFEANTGAIKGSAEIMEDSTATSTVVGPDYSYGADFTVAELCDSPIITPTASSTASSTLVEDKEPGKRTQFAGSVTSVSPCYSDSGSLKDRFREVVISPCNGTVPVIGRAYENNPITGQQTDINGSQYGVGSLSPAKFVWDAADGGPLPAVGQEIFGGTAHPKADAFSEKCPRTSPTGSNGLSAGATDGGWLGMGYSVGPASDSCPAPESDDDDGGGGIFGTIGKYGGNIYFVWDAVLDVVGINERFGDTAESVGDWADSVIGW